MSRHYKPDPGGKHTTKISMVLWQTIEKKTTFSGMFKKHSISIEELYRSAINNPALIRQGGQAALSESTELHIAQRSLLVLFGASRQTTLTCAIF